ncbi:hypothetical protein Tco_1251708, partial [Tanacetum coccineum]
YDHVDCTTQESINYAAGGRLRQIRPDEAWDTIERLAQYENEGWNNAFTPYEVYFNYENPDVEQLLGIMERKVDTLMKGAISLMGKSKSIFRLITNEMCRSPIVPSRQEEFEHIVMNFIYDQEERTRQLKNYRQDITDEFMKFSSKFTLRLKKRIKENESKPRKIKKIIKYPETKDLENSAKHNFFENLEKKSFPTPASHLCVRDVWYDLLHKGVTFRLGGVEREMSLLELGWRVGLYSKRESGDVATLSKLRGALTANSSRLNHLFWPSIGDDRYNVGNTKAKSIRNPRIKLAHRCITMIITGRKETTHRVTKIDLFYLYCIFGERIVCDIPYWLAKYLKSIREKGMIFRGMFVTKIARSFGLLTEEMVSVLSREPPLHVYRKTSLIKMGVIMELHEGECFWPATREVVGEGKAMMRKAMEKG